MARGKHGQSATTRRAHEAAESQIEVYQRNVKRLTEENRELREKLQAEQAGRRQDIRALKAQLNEGLSPELMALRRKLDEQAERASAATQQLAAQREAWIKIEGRFRALLVSQFSVSKTDAEIVVALLAQGLPLETPGTPESVMARMRKKLGGQDGVDRVLMADRNARRYYRNDLALTDAASRISGKRESE